MVVVVVMEGETHRVLCHGGGGGRTIHAVQKSILVAGHIEVICLYKVESIQTAEMPGYITTKETKSSLKCRLLAMLSGNLASSERN